MRNDKTEEFLRAELRSLREIAFQLCRWGVTVEIGIASVIYFIRRDVWETLTRRGLIAAGSPLPDKNYWMGTLGLLIIASVFSILTLLATVNYWHYQNQLADVSQSGIKPTPKWRQVIGLLIVIALYFAFPVLDQALRTYKLEIGVLW